MPEPETELTYSVYIADLTNYGLTQWEAVEQFGPQDLVIGSKEIDDLNGAVEVYIRGVKFVKAEIEVKS